MISHKDINRAFVKLTPPNTTGARESRQPEYNLFTTTFGFLAPIDIETAYDPLSFVNPTDQNSRGMSAYFTTHHFSPRWSSPEHSTEPHAITSITAPTAGATAGTTAAPALPADPHVHHGGLEALARYLHAFNSHNTHGQASHDVVHPHFDLAESKSCYAVYGELPGLETDTVNVEVNDHLFTVTVSGDLKRPLPPGANDAAPSNVGVVHKDAQPSPPTKTTTTEAESSKTGEATEEKSTETEGELRWHVTERRTGHFRRAFQFPIEQVDMSAIKASMQAGLLTILVPKKQGRSELAAARKVDVVEAGVDGHVLAAVGV